MTSTSLTRKPRGRPTLDGSIPPILRPLIRAYVLGYASAVAPRVLTLVLRYASKRRGNKGPANVTRPHDSFFTSLQHILCGGLELQRFPTFCAALVGGTTLLEARRTLPLLLSRWISSFVASWLSLRLLQSKKTDGFSETIDVSTDSPSGPRKETIRYAGRTLDLTLFATTRALDVIVGELWARRRQRRLAAGQWTRIESSISKLTDPSIFSISCAFVMWAWFYSPSSLPRAYTKWISSAAAVDSRLIEALRRCREGTLVYGKDTPEGRILQSMCSDYKWPLEWGDPATTIPFRCEIVHMGSSSSCEYHAISRFLRSFKWSVATYLPLNILTRKKDLKGLRSAVLSAARSSSFLATFITLFYYGVCLARTRVGPHIIGKDTKARQMIDSGVCVGTGCFMCGWSILIEKPSRRKDMALFVAPRAMATLLPRRYSLDKQWRETFVFAFSTAVVFTCVRENKQRVRGMLGNVLASVLNT
ncbi:integral membrane protein [Biscogniauxia sp. FL1348]|nr:integral membrane protein [Biscogniauxia sp. FL1348]